MKEEWRDIRDYPGYKVSNMGRVKGPRKDSLKLVDGGQGYLKVTLSKNGKHVDKRVNRLVAQAFLPNPNGLPLVMHKDNVRSNNNIDNLAWGTTLENNRWMYECGRHGNNITENVRKMGNAARRTPVKSIDIATLEERTFDGQHTAARALGVSQQHVWGVLNGRRKSTGGYRFEYVTKEESINGL